MTSSEDERLMRRALALAARAARQGDVPVGAVVVCDGMIVGRGYNRREQRQDATEHAEMMALRQASRRLGSWRLDRCDLYVTLEPCVMCAGAIIQSRIRSLVFGAKDPKAGACGSITSIEALSHNHVVSVQGGILAGESRALLLDFFRQRRAADRAEGSKARRRQKAVDKISQKAGPDRAAQE